MKFDIAVLPGDGIGPEVIAQAENVIKAVESKTDIEFVLHHSMIGGCAIDEKGEPLPKSTVDLCKKCDSVLLGAVGGPKWDHLDGKMRPEAGLLGIRKQLGLYANLRPAVIYNALMEASPLKQGIIDKGIDVLVVRELTGGMYFGEKRRYKNENGEETALDTEIYSENEIRRIAKTAFECAFKRKKKVTSVDKANVLESSRLWRSVVSDVAKDYEDVVLEHMYVDNAAMQLIKNPKQFDVIVTSNMFGDILSDEASMITGSIGLLPSASLGDGKLGLYEPVHGSAPDIAGKNKANPLATVLSVAMMFRYSLGLPEIAFKIDKAVEKVLDDGWRTADIAYHNENIIGTDEMGQKVVEALLDMF